MCTHMYAAMTSYTLIRFASSNDHAARLGAMCKSLPTRDGSYTWWRGSNIKLCQFLRPSTSYRHHIFAMPPP
ncbi:hypothetical protein RJ55_05335 [Drechmeria coniospora]|nr:hypothetical protein RJ55_05335 [Drechmeria coniospora]